MASMNLEPIHFTDLEDNINNDKGPLLGAIFLFFLIFFTFLFVYFLYICTHRRHVDGGGNPTTPPGAAGLDPATISVLPVFSYGSSDKKPSPGAECAICLSLFQEDEMVKVLPLCRHGFHADCVDKWLRTRSSCPLCRACIQRADSVCRELDSELP